MVTLPEAREKALEYRRLAKAGLNPRCNVPATYQASRTSRAPREASHLEERQARRAVDHDARGIRVSVIGRRSVADIGQPEVLACLSPIWTSKPETARRLAQRIGTVLEVARSKGFRTGENPVTAIRGAKVLPKVTVKAKHHAAMDWRRAGALRGPPHARCHRGQGAYVYLPDRISHQRGAWCTWQEFDLKTRLWTVPAARMKGGVAIAFRSRKRCWRCRAVEGSELASGLRGAEAAPAALKHGDAHAASTNGWRA